MQNNPFTALERHFHEPHRLAIMSALCGAVNGMSFRELKGECDLTDGNLNRHLKKLEETEAVRIEKSFVGGKPRTTVYASDKGRDMFIEYLAALEAVLKQAVDSVAVESVEKVSIPLREVVHT